MQSLLCLGWKAASLASSPSLPFKRSASLYLNMIYSKLYMYTSLPLKSLFWLIIANNLCKMLGLPRSCRCAACCACSRAWCAPTWSTVHASGWRSCLEIITSLTVPQWANNTRVWNLKDSAIFPELDYGIFIMFCYYIFIIWNHFRN